MARHSSSSGEGQTAQRIGRYEILGPLARGGMAEVLRAAVEGPGGFRREVALKRVLPELARDAEFARLFTEEARLAARLHHANVVQVLDFGEYDGISYLVMELVEGRDLRRILARAAESERRMPIRLAAFVCAEVLRGLAHAHGLVDEQGQRVGLIHRDVSPHNVLVSQAGEVKLSDFGIAKALDATARAGRTTVRGKIAYMAPEQANGEPVDARADLFSLGIVLYETLTGRRLFGQGSDREIFARLLAGTIETPRRHRPEISDGLAAFALRLLARDPAGRPDTAELALRELSEIEPIGATASLDLAAFVRELFAPGARPGEGRGATRSLPAARPGKTLPPTATLEPGETRFVPDGERAATPPLQRAVRFGWRSLLLGVSAGAALALTVIALRGPRARVTRLPHVLTAGGVGETPAPSTPKIAAAAPSEAVTGGVAAGGGVPVRVSIDPADARLFVDGAPVTGPPPWNLFFDAGRHVSLHAEREGYRPVTTVVAVVPHQPPIDLHLAPRAPVSRAAVATAAGSSPRITTTTQVRRTSAPRSTDPVDGLAAPR